MRGPSACWASTQPSTRQPPSSCTALISLSPEIAQWAKPIARCSNTYAKASRVACPLQSIVGNNKGRHVPRGTVDLDAVPLLVPSRPRDQSSLHDLGSVIYKLWAMMDAALAMFISVQLQLPNLDGSVQVLQEYFQMLEPELFASVLLDLSLVHGQSGSYAI